MSYPAKILSALINMGLCKHCHDVPRTAHIVSIEPYIAVDRDQRSRLRCIVKALCPCRSCTRFYLDLNREELDQTIRELRLRANRPPGRHEDHQAYVFGPKVPPLGRVTPSAQRVPSTPITDDEVAAFQERMARTNFEVNEISTNTFLLELFEARAGESDENDSGADDQDE